MKLSFTPLPLTLAAIEAERLACVRAKAYLLACYKEGGGQHSLASMDSDLDVPGPT